MIFSFEKSKKGEKGKKKSKKHVNSQCFCIFFCLFRFFLTKKRLKMQKKMKKHCKFTCFFVFFLPFSHFLFFSEEKIIVKLSAPRTPRRFLGVSRLLEVSYLPPSLTSPTSTPPPHRHHHHHQSEPHFFAHVSRNSPTKGPIQGRTSKRQGGREGSPHPMPASRVFFVI